MRSITTKLFLLICGAVFVVFILLSTLSGYYMSHVINEDSVAAMTMLADQKSRELNVHFKSVAQAVELLKDHICDNIDPVRLQTDRTYAQAFMAEVADYGMATANVAGNVATLYFRPDPVAYGSTAGLFLTEDGTGGFTAVPPTDILKYDRNDREHVGWYYEPVERGEAIWMDPYANNNIDVYMISYVTPLYVDETLIGVVGMDIDMSVIRNVVDSVGYADGIGFLLDASGNIIYHRDYPDGLSAARMDEGLKEIVQYINTHKDNREIYRCDWQGDRRRLVSAALENGMTFVVSVPESTLLRNSTLLQSNMFFVFSIVLILTLVVARGVMVRVVRPIQELTTASSRIAKGEMNVTIHYRSDDELGALANSIRLMEKELREYISYIHEQAYTDAMTGVGNKTAYLDMVRLIERKIQEGMAEFTVIVFDVNGLKTINDHLGHEYGDKIITQAAGAIKEVFGAEHAYRIGGDEFIVVLERTDQEATEQSFREFDAVVERMNAEEKTREVTLAVSKGASFYRQDEDQEYREVFRRADEEMYRDKEKFYRGKNDRRRR
ncbi:MAG: diguanylate cyclase [Lachnospiraceae bacterium]|nr:diguanylate cyclase [Lachnospiraceae bacterium]